MRDKMDSPSDDLTRHAGLRSIDQCIFAEGLHIYTQLILHKLDRLPTRESVASDNCRRMDLCFHKLVRPSKKFSGNDYNRRGPIPNLLVLFLGKVDEYATSWVLDGEKAKDGGTIIRDRDFLTFANSVRVQANQQSIMTHSNVVNKHFVQSKRTKGAFHDVCDRHSRNDYTPETSVFSL